MSGSTPPGARRALLRSDQTASPALGIHCGIHGLAFQRADGDAMTAQKKFCGQYRGTEIENADSE